MIKLAKVILLVLVLVLRAVLDLKSTSNRGEKQLDALEAYRKFERWKLTNNQYPW